jgi:uncharacterized protein YndB with AHSA1/START domain
MQQQGYHTGTMKTFIYNIFINTTAPKLWEALTSKEFSRQYWSGHEIRSDWKVGSPVSLIKKNGTANWQGTILSYEPNTSLSYTFDVSVDPRFHGINSKYGRFLAEEPISKVTYKLEPIGDAILLTIIHEELSDTLEEVARMSWVHVASSLKSLLETGKPLATPNA